ncbi:hypothetical protein L485_17000 [Sphingobium baderi LL03]|uniref:DNA-binding protein n=1 Tax=Sphingobium baderi LL03 TaxID=1114964 RepID=T0HLE6_9SPHN|nr:hypothetical protein L485_17000 [Sphingobium baderi LL03]
MTPLNRFYWEAGREGVLKIMQCRECGTWIHPAAPICPSCLSENVAPQPVEGTGGIYSITVNYQAWAPGLDVPYAIARVALDGVDGVLLTTNIVGDGAVEAAIGDRVQVCFEEQDGIWFPLFTRAQEDKR